MSFLNMSLIKITYNFEREPSPTRSALPHANPRTIPTSTKQRESTSHAKVQSLRHTLLQETFNATIPHTVINYNYAYTFAQLKNCAEALLNKLPELETTTPKSFPSNDFQCTAIHRRLMHAVLDCGEVGSEEWRTIMAEEVKACLHDLQDLDDDMTLSRSERRAVEAARLRVLEDGYLVLQILTDSVKYCATDCLAKLIFFVPAGMDSKVWVCLVCAFIISLVALVISAVAFIRHWV
jgi:hypothetical protein